MWKNEEWKIFMNNPTLVIHCLNCGGKFEIHCDSILNKPSICCPECNSNMSYDVFYLLKNSIQSFSECLERQHNLNVLVKGQPKSDSRFKVSLKWKKELPE